MCIRDSIHGVTVIGDGNVVNTTFADLSRVLADTKTAILAEPQLTEAKKLEAIADVDSLQAQLQKPNPDRTVVQKLWSGIEKTAALGGIAAVSYTHLDVYKRQPVPSPLPQLQLAPSAADATFSSPSFERRRRATS